METNDELNFNQDITHVRKSASNQLNTLIRPNYLLTFEERRALVNTFAMSNHN